MKKYITACATLLLASCLGDCFSCAGDYECSKLCYDDCHSNGGIVTTATQAECVIDCGRAVCDDYITVRPNFKDASSVEDASGSLPDAGDTYDADVIDSSVADAGLGCGVMCARKCTVDGGLDSVCFSACLTNECGGG